MNFFSDCHWGAEFSETDKRIYLWFIGEKFKHFNHIKLTVLVKSLWISCLSRVARSWTNYCAWWSCQVFMSLLLISDCSKFLTVFDHTLQVIQPYNEVESLRESDQRQWEILLYQLRKILSELNISRKICTGGKSQSLLWLDYSLVILKGTVASTHEPTGHNHQYFSSPVT